MKAIVEAFEEIRARMGWKDSDDFLAECAVVLYYRMMYGEWKIA